MTTRFVHLHCHSHYSLLDGANRIPELVARVKELGMNAVAITDHGNLYGAIEFYRACKDAGINPIIGYEAYVAPGSRTEREARRRGEAGFHLTLLAQNATGFKNLVKMASLAFLDGYHYVPRIDKSLLERFHEGIICLSGCASAEFSEFILKDQIDEATELARWFSRVFGKNFYVEIQNNGLEIQRRCAEGAIEIANRLGLPLVATCDAHYLQRDDNLAHDVLLCINTGKTLKDENRMRYGSDQFYIRAPEEMYQLFGNQAEAVERSQEIADGVDIRLDFKARHFPVFTPPEKKTPEDYLRELCEKGLAERYGDAAAPPLSPQGRGVVSRQAAIERLNHELDIICRMGFASYFLIVWDFVRFAQDKGIPCGARGSACGALVAYVLGLSTVDPLQYDLLFERFLDPSRSEAPDIDIDFCQERRDEVIQYVRQKYGEQSVAQIVTFGTLQAKAAIRDVGRVLDIPLDRVNRLCNMVPRVLNISLDDALAQSPDLRHECEGDPQIQKLIDLAKRLEGTNRNAGTHAAGVVIANGNLTDYVPLHRVLRKGYENGNRAPESIITTQWVMGDLEKVGLLKMDFLGLRTLTLLDHAVKLIEKTRGIKIDLQKIPLDDAKTYALLQRGDAKGVFQLESDGIRELLKRMKPDRILDLIATNALYRPGPLGGGMVDAYVNRKHGREKPVYDHPIMEEVLTETHGVLVYQEQCMRVLNRLGGVELASAYACIKAISKKKQDVIDEQRAEFLKGAQERGVTMDTAQRIFDLILQFAGYGFNKSHSTAYALIGYQTAYLKAHYTPEFMAALLSSEIEDSNKRDAMVEHIADARKLGVEVLPPDVQAGDVEFTVPVRAGSVSDGQNVRAGSVSDGQNVRAGSVSDGPGGQVLFGLTAIKGLGRGAATDIVRARTDKGPFRDLFDFCERVDLKIVSRAAIERLVMAGAFDKFGAARAELWEAIPRAIAGAGEVQSDKKHGQGSLFGVAEPETQAAGPSSEGLRDIPEWASGERLKREKEALDFYISSHPLAQHGDDLARFATHTVGQIAELPANTEVFLGGMITQVRFMNTKKARNGNSRYVRCKLEDFTGSVECVMWPDDFTRFKDFFTEDRICFVAGVVERNRDEPGLILTRALSIEQGKRERTTGLVLFLNLREHGPHHIEALGHILHRARGSLPVFLHIQDPAGNWLKLKSSDEFKINPDTLVASELETLLGPGHVQFARQGNGNGRGGH